MLPTTLLLSLCALTLAHPAEDIVPKSPAITPIPPINTCPASTPHVYVTTITTTTYRERHCPSYITRVDTPAPWSTCSFNTLTCTRPACLSLKTITWPCNTDPCCTRTATDTVYASCPTKCPTGCATSWEVVRASCPTARPTPY
ncbi:hypothetical protein BU26DRAFT_525559 [Trematosphaeria pertusa]|uniref:Uncharacterized protein n=1 Tax=Trematosphaeria pertusa TaxID=390896 RepID=A0A6A6HSD4_9PLEO|nr:uncharacterized protein BU26DRAFT_525559 [Trematosphaeria pertusa]KAF2241026.1 hypothetical protein BU26DRAFT_525559 [Trematosphaeria pertusa]